MPLSKYYGGKGRSVMRAMVSRYGTKTGKRVFYAVLAKREQERREKT